MAGKLTLYRQRHCVAKRTFRSLELATEAASSATSRVLFSTPLSAYKCRVGRHWHIGHDWRVLQAAAPKRIYYSGPANLPLTNPSSSESLEHID